MNLLKKILPTILVGTTSTICLVGVGCNNENLSPEKKPEIDGLTMDIQTLLEHGFKRTIEPSSLENIKANEANGIYLKAINDNKDLFAEDLFDYWGNINKSEQLLALPTGSTGQITIGEVSIDQTNSTLSFAIQIDALIPTKIDPGKKGNDFEFTTNCNLILRFNKIPVTCEYQGVITDTKINLWLMSIDLMSSIWSSVDWSMSLIGTVDLISTDAQSHSDVNFVLNKNNDEWNQTIELLAASIYLQHPMFYFKNAKAGK